jgi:thiamine kinase-like enzyme
MTSETEEVGLTALYALRGHTRDEVRAARWTRLPGLTNRVWRVDVGAAVYCLRIPGSGTTAIIDRQAEETNARAAWRAGVAPEILHFGADGVMITRFVANAVALARPLLKERGDARECAAKALRLLHDTAEAFVGTFGIFATSDGYSRLLRERGVAVSPGERAVLKEAEAVRSALAAAPAELKPCHCDTTGANLLDDGERVWLVDWEYSGMNDPMWDLSYLSVQADLDPAQDDELLDTYLGRTPQADETARMAVLKAPVEIMSALWALVQHSAGNRSGDFPGYAEATFARCLERMRVAEFRRQLAALRAE